MTYDYNSTSNYKAALKSRKVTYANKKALCAFVHGVQSHTLHPRDSRTFVTSLHKPLSQHNRPQTERNIEKGKAKKPLKQETQQGSVKKLAETETILR